MTKKAKQLPNEKTGFLSKKQITIIAIAVVLTVSLCFAVFLLFLQPSEVSFTLSVAIIDQLSREIPNPRFAENVTAILANHNFTVTYLNTTVNVDFFKNLTKGNYGMIIFRAHVALREDGSTVDFFTSEQFNPNLHLQEQESGLVVKGVLNYSGIPKSYFAVSPQFIEGLEGTFPKSIIVAMGCWSAKPDLEKPMADAFIKKGAKAFIGWTNLVGASHSDIETAKLIKSIAENRTLGQAVASITPDRSYPPYISQMKYYPESAKDLRIYGLTSKKDSISYEPRLTTSDSYAKVKHCKRFRRALDLVDQLSTLAASRQPCTTDF